MARAARVDWTSPWRANTSPSPRKPGYAEPLLSLLPLPPPPLKANQPVARLYERTRSAHVRV